MYFLRWLVVYGNIILSLAVFSERKTVPYLQLRDMTMMSDKEPFSCDEDQEVANLFEKSNKAVKHKLDVECIARRPKDVAGKSDQSLLSCAVSDSSSCSLCTSALIKRKKTTKRHFKILVAISSTFDLHNLCAKIWCETPVAVHESFFFKIVTSACLLSCLVSDTSLCSTYFCTNQEK